MDGNSRPNKKNIKLVYGWFQKSEVTNKSFRFVTSDSAKISIEIVHQMYMDLTEILGAFNLKIITILYTIPWQHLPIIGN